MQSGLVAPNFEGLEMAEGSDQTAAFCAKFQHALRECIRHRFSMEESFGMIWVETLEEVPLLPQEQAHVYDLLIEWAKSCSGIELFAHF